MASANGTACSAWWLLSRRVGTGEIVVPCGESSVVGRAGAISRGCPRRVNLLVHGRGGSDHDGGGN